MQKTAAIIFGVVFLLVGILGFIPAVAPNGYLFGLFYVNDAHNVIHLISGVIALIAGTVSLKAATTYFQVFGVIYGLIGLLGLFVGHGMMFGMVAHNMADVWLHLAIAAVSLFLGFGRVENWMGKHAHG